MRTTQRYFQKTINFFYHFGETFSKCLYSTTIYTLLEIYEKIFKVFHHRNEIKVADVDDDDEEQEQRIASPLELPQLSIYFLLLYN